MALRTILEFPDPRLRTRAQPVTRFDAALGTLIADMLETMYAAPGIGLAATQIDVHKRLIVIDLSKDHNEPLVIINPEILSREGEASSEEGCLSVPGWVGEVTRRQRVVAKGLNRHGKEVRVKGDGLLARAVQHELDHLDGILFTSRVNEGTLREVEPAEEAEEPGVVSAV